jgi:hypothetical protein
VLSTRAWVFSFIGALGITILLAVVGRLFLGGENTFRARPHLELPMKVAVFSLFLVMGFSGLALMLRLFVAGQRRIGNEGHPLVRLLAAHDTAVMTGLFALVGLGLAIAIPAAMSDGFFGPEAQRWIKGLGRPRPSGVLVANIGMTLDDVRRRSTVPVPAGAPSVLTGSTTVIGDMPFEFRIADTGMAFPGARYFFLVTRKKGDQHLESMNVGVSAEALPRGEFDAFRRRIQEQFQSDGWAAGRFVYRTEQERQLHGGMTSSGEGSYWLKGDTLVSFEPKRVDDEQRGEDPGTAGKWILALSLWDRATSPSYSRLEFTRP